MRLLLVALAFVIGSDVFAQLPNSPATSPPADADLSVELTKLWNGVYAAYAAGDRIDYVISVRNDGPGDAASVVLSNPLPAGTSFYYIDAPAGWSCLTPPDHGTGTITCSIPSLAPGIISSFRIDTETDSSLSEGTVISNTSSVSSTTSDPNAANNSCTFTIPLTTLSELTAYLSDLPDPVSPGSTLTYTLSVSGGRPSDALSVSAVDHWPAGLVLKSYTTPPHWTCTPSVIDRTLTCETPVLKLLSYPVFEITFTVDSDLPVGTILTNDWRLSSPTPAVAWVPRTGSTTTTVTEMTTAIAGLELRDSWDVAPSYHVLPGGTVTFDLSISNWGPNNAANVVITKPLPPGFRFVSLSNPAPGWSCTTPPVGSTGTVSCSTPSFPPTLYGEKFKLTAQLDRTGMANRTISCQSQVSSPTPDQFGGNRRGAGCDIRVGHFAQLRSTIAVSGQHKAGDVVTYRVVMTNEGNGPQGDNPGHEMTDDLPPELEFVSASATTGTVAGDLLLNRVSWDGAIDVGASVTIDVETRINRATKPGTIVRNDGSTSYDADGDGTNDTGSEFVGGETTYYGVSFVVEPGVTAANIPTLAGFALAALASLLAGLGVLLSKR